MQRRSLSIRAAAAVGAAALSFALAIPPADAQPLAQTSTVQPSASAAAFALHPLVARFTDGWNAGDAAAMEAVFAPSAVLIDDKRRFEGRDAMRGFLQSEARNYRIRILEVQQRRADGMKLLVMVTGVGTGFRATFDFTIAGDRVTLANLQYA